MSACFSRTSRWRHALLSGCSGASSIIGILSTAARRILWKWLFGRYSPARLSSLHFDRALTPSTSSGSRLRTAGSCRGLSTLCLRLGSHILNLHSPALVVLVGLWMIHCFMINIAMLPAEIANSWCWFGRALCWFTNRSASIEHGHLLLFLRRDCG